jgi:hypothetical protein
MTIFSCLPPCWSASFFFRLVPIVSRMMSLAITNAIFGTVGTWFGAL